MDSLPLSHLGSSKKLAAAAAAKSLQSCPTLCDPETIAHQDPQSLGFSRQEHWSGLSFPSPKKVAQVNILKIIILFNLYKLVYFVLKEKDTHILS